VPGRVILCDGFWSAPDAGTGSKPGALIHVYSYYTNTTDNLAGQYLGAEFLAHANPWAAIYNAANYQNFAEKAPFPA
jgi:peptidyl-Lys metalloendopeptidase